MASTGNKLDLTVFKLIGDQYEGVLFVFVINSGKFLYLNDAFEPLWKRLQTILLLSWILFILKIVIM